MPRQCMIIAGATATGKSAVAQVIAERINAAIVSADSMLVYRGLDVGTAKPTAEERRRVRYIGVDCVSPDQRFSTGDWLEHVQRGIATLPAEMPIVVAGGTGLYIKALQEGLDAPPSNPEMRRQLQELFEQGGIAALQREVAKRDIAVNASDALNPRRLLRALERAAAGAPPAKPSSALDLQALFADAKSFLLTMDRNALATRIERRARMMFEQGIVEEAVNVFGKGTPSETAAGAIGYAEALAYARDEISLNEAIDKVATRTRQLAKRQRTWFRHQFVAQEIAISPSDSADAVAERLLSWNSPECVLSALQ